MKIIESQNTHTSAVETDRPNSESNEQLVEYKPIGKTPFTAVRNEETWFITVGKYKAPHDFKSYEECYDYVEENMWEMIGLFTTVIVEENNKLNNGLF